MTDWLSLFGNGIYMTIKHNLDAKGNKRMGVSHASWTKHGSARSRRVGNNSRTCSSPCRAGASRVRVHGRVQEEVQWGAERALQGLAQEVAERAHQGVAQGVAQGAAEEAHPGVV